MFILISPVNFGPLLGRLELTTRREKHHQSNPLTPCKTPQRSFWSPTGLFVEVLTLSSLNLNLFDSLTFINRSSFRTFPCIIGIKILDFPTSSFLLSPNKVRDWIRQVCCTQLNSTCILARKHPVLSSEYFVSLVRQRPPLPVPLPGRRLCDTYPVGTTRDLLVFVGF